MSPPDDVSAGSLRPGDVIDRYRVFKPLARGGMAELFLARAQGPGGVEQVVVIKRILPELAARAEVRTMFLDEARVIATLHHPNIVQIHEVGVADGSYFMAMEYLHGEDLFAVQRELVRRGRRLPLEHALQIAIAVCAGLHYAHEAVDLDGRPLHIVHRDVSPQNVFVTYAGGVKLLDFGVARAANRVLRTTRHGTIKGKLSYLSPEQCRGEPLDRRCDLFSLGILLYEMTLGRKLFRGKSDFEILQSIVESEIARPRSIDPEYPPELEAIVLRALERDPMRRWQTAAEMQDALETLALASGRFLPASHLARFMEELFGTKIEAWRAAQAQGRSLAEYLERTQTSFHVLSEETVEEADQARLAGHVDPVDPIGPIGPIGPIDPMDPMGHAGEIAAAGDGEHGDRPGTTASETPRTPWHGIGVAPGQAEGAPADAAAFALGEHTEPDADTPVPEDTGRGGAGGFVEDEPIELLRREDRIEAEIEASGRVFAPAVQVGLGAVIAGSVIGGLLALVVIWLGGWMP